MSKSKNSIDTNNEVVCTDNSSAVRETSNQTPDEKYRDQFTEIVLDAGRGFINSIRENLGDYKTISEDRNMSPVEKALGKRKLLETDIKLGTIGTGSLLGLIWFAKKVFVA